MNVKRVGVPRLHARIGAEDRGFGVVVRLDNMPGKPSRQIYAQRH